MISCVACMAKNRVIGYQGHLPWHFTMDLKFFKQVTIDKTIVMGRKTYESLPFHLPRRKHVLVTKNKSYNNPLITPLYEFNESIIRSLKDPEIFIVGGESLFRASMPWVDQLYLTEINKVYQGDAYFPEFDTTLFDKHLLFSSFENGVKLDFNCYIRKMDLKTF